MACLALSLSRLLYIQTALPPFLPNGRTSACACCVDWYGGFCTSRKPKGSVFGLGYSRFNVSGFEQTRANRPVVLKELADLIHKNVRFERCSLRLEGVQSLGLTQIFVRVYTTASAPEAIAFDRLLDRESSITGLASLLRDCGKAKTLLDGRYVHIHVCRCGYDGIMFLGNCLVQMYGNCGSMEEALATFERLPNQNSYSWTILLSAYGQNGRLEDANMIFGRMPYKSVVSWNAIMAAFIQNGCGKDALNLFSMMQLEGIQPDNISFVCALDACASLKALEEGKKLHVAIAEIDKVQELVVGTALVSMYGKCGSVHNASNVFGRITPRDVVCWNAMIAAFAQNEHGKEALKLYLQMQLEGVKPDNISFLCILDACASLSSLNIGLDVHAAIVDSGYEQEIVVGTSLVNLYGKCGSLHNAENLFARMPHRNVFSWNAMIGAFAQSGHGKESLSLLQQMQLEGIKPDSTTFLSILTACSHTGLVEVGQHFFLSMVKDHGIEPTIDHYGCMIDLLGRAGHLDKAEDLLNGIPLEKDAVTWRCLLGACKMHSDMERGLRTANKCFGLGSKNAAPYVMLSNMYVVDGNPDGAAGVMEA